MGDEPRTAALPGRLPRLVPLPSRALLLAAGMLFWAAASSAAPPLPIRIGTGVTDTYAEANYGAQAGLLSASGLDPTFVVPANSATIAAAVAGGSIDIGIGSLVSVAQGYERGLPYQCVAPGALYTSAAPTTLLMVARNSPLRSARDLVGKIVGVDSLRGQPEVSMTAWLAKNGLNAAAVRYIEIPFSAMGPALEAGRIDAAIAAEPALTSMKPETRVFADPYSAVGREWYINCWFSTKDWIAKNPDAVRAFITAMERTAKWANAHPRETLPVLEQITRLPPEIAEKMTRGRFSEKPLSPALMQPLLDAANAAGLLKDPISAKDLIASP